MGNRVIVRANIVRANQGSLKPCLFTMNERSPAFWTRTHGPFRETGYEGDISLLD